MKTFNFTISENNKETFNENLNIDEVMNVLRNDGVNLNDIYGWDYNTNIRLFKEDISKGKTMEMSHEQKDFVVKLK